jgi:hypothetical protein
VVKPISEQAVVERLRQVRTEIDRLPLPVGDLGCQFLDALELVDQIRTRVREKAKELLLKELGLIPGWKAVEGGPVRELSRDTLRIFEESAERAFQILAKAETLFLRGGRVVQLVPSETGLLRLEVVSEQAFRSRIERDGKVVAYRAGSHGEELIKADARCSLDTATA